MADIGLLEKSRGRTVVPEGWEMNLLGEYKITGSIEGALNSLTEASRRGVGGIAYGKLAGKVLRPFAIDASSACLPNFRRLNPDDERPSAAIEAARRHSAIENPTETDEMEMRKEANSALTAENAALALAGSKGELAHWFDAYSAIEAATSARYSAVASMLSKGSLDTGLLTRTVAAAANTSLLSAYLAARALGSDGKAERKAEEDRQKGKLEELVNLAVAEGRRGLLEGEFRSDA